MEHLYFLSEVEIQQILKHKMFSTHSQKHVYSAINTDALYSLFQ